MMGCLLSGERYSSSDDGMSVTGERYSGSDDGMSVIRGEIQ